MKINHAVFSLFLCVALGLPAHSQTLTNPISIPLEKGSHFFGLNATGGYSGEPTKISDFRITAQGGIFAAQGLVTGIQLGYDKLYMSRPLSSVVGLPLEVDAERLVRNFSPELFARYYFFQTKFRPMLQVSAGGIFQSIDRTSFSGIESNESSSEFIAAAGVGLGWFVSKRVAVELLYQLRTRPAAYTSSKELRLGVSVFLK